MKTELPKIQTGLELGGDRYGFFSVIVPEDDTINYVTNPAFFTDDPNCAYKAGVAPGNPAYGYTFSNCTAAKKDRPVSIYGSGIKISPVNRNAETSTTSFAIANLSAGTYTFSAYYSANTQNKYSLSVYKTGGSIKLAESAKLYGGGINNFQRQSVTFTITIEQSIEVKLIQHKDTGPKLFDFYTDAWQVENKPYMTSHFTGSSTVQSMEMNSDAYQWLGTPFFSESKRTDQAYTSGREIDLSSVGFRLTGIVGLGVMPFNTTINDVASGGGEYDNTVPAQRIFTLVGSIYGKDLQEILTKRKALYDLIRPNGRNIKDQPLTLLFRIWDCKKERVIGQPLYIYCRYTSGLEGALESENGENISITFKSEDPYIYSAYTKAYYLNPSGFHYQPPADSSNVSPIFMWRDEDGVWEQLPIRLSEPYGVPTNDVCVVKNIVPDKMGGYFLYGNFKKVIYNNAETICNGVFRYNHNTKTVSACGTGTVGIANNIITKILVIPSGDAYVVGNFSSAGGVANTKCIAKYRPSTNTWESVSSGIADFGNTAAIIKDIEYGDDNNIYVAGIFNSIDGIELNHTMARMDVATKEWEDIPVYRAMYYTTTQGVEFIRLLRQRTIPGYFIRPTTGFIAGGLTTFAQPRTQGIVYWNGRETFHTLWNRLMETDVPANPLIGARKGIIDQNTGALYCITGNSTLHKLDYVQPEFDYIDRSGVTIMSVYKYPDRPSPSIWKKLTAPFQEKVYFSAFSNEDPIDLSHIFDSELKIFNSRLTISPNFSHGLSPNQSSFIPSSKIVPLIWYHNISRGNESESTFLPWHISAKDYAYSAAFDIDFNTGRGFVAVNPGHITPKIAGDNIVNCLVDTNKRIDNNGERTPVFFLINGPATMRGVGNKTSKQSMFIDGFKVAEKEALSFSSLSGFGAESSRWFHRHILGNSDIDMQLLPGKNIAFAEIEDVKEGETRVQIGFRERYADIAKAIEYVGG